jgi:RNA polymerase sigma-70 factor (sigma-E family)
MRAADDADFTAFVAGSSRRLLGLAYLLTGDVYAAEDLLQGALERTYRSWSRVNRDGVPEAYVRQALVNAATDRWRRRKGVVEVEHVDGRLSEPDGSEQTAARDALMRAVRELSAGQRAVLVLRYFEGLTETQTAAVMGCSIGTVKSQHARAMSRLRTLLPTGRL